MLFIILCCFSFNVPVFFRPYLSLALYFSTQHGDHVARDSVVFTGWYLLDTAAKNRPKGGGKSNPRCKRAGIGPWVNPTCFSVWKGYCLGCTNPSQHNAACGFRSAKGLSLRMGHTPVGSTRGCDSCGVLNRRLLWSLVLFCKPQRGTRRPDGGRDAACIGVCTPTAAILNWYYKLLISEKSWGSFSKHLVSAASQEFFILVVVQPAGFHLGALIKHRTFSGISFEFTQKSRTEEKHPLIVPHSTFSYYTVSLNREDHLRWTVCETDFQGMGELYIYFPCW